MIKRFAGPARCTMGISSRGNLSDWWRAVVNELNKCQSPAERKAIQQDWSDHGPDIVYFKLFNNCNAKCNICDCWTLPRTETSAEHYKGVLNATLVRAPKRIRFTGGEPLLSPVLPELVGMASSAGAVVSVITNGRLLGTKAQQLANHGCAEIVLSLDAVGDTHDLLRGTPRLFELTLRGIVTVSETPLALGVNTVVQRGGVRSLYQLADLLLSQPRVPSWWQLIPVRDRPHLLPTEEDQSWLTETISNLRRTMASEGVQVIADARMFDPAKQSRCSVPQFAIYVDAETGDVFGCNMLAYADSPIGNILHASLESVWHSREALRVRSECAESIHQSCARCDPASRAMNYWLANRRPKE